MGFESRGYSLKDSNVGKKYVLVEGMQLDSSLLKITTPSKKQGNSTKTSNSPLNAQCRAKVLELLSKYRCGQKLFTIRELTCKTVPTWCQNAAFLCPVEDCPHIYFYQKSFKSHLSSQHKIPIDTHEEICQKAQLICGRMWGSPEDEDEDEDVLIYRLMETHVEAEFLDSQILF